jgi:cell division protein FtsW
MRSGFEAESASAARRGDGGMLAAVLLLAGVGVAALWSASSEYALSLGRPSGYFALRQALFLVPSALVFWACAVVDLDALRARTGAITLIALGLMLLPFIPGLGQNRNGANRWIDLRFTGFQPSELLKPALVLYLAHILDKKRDRMEESAGVLVPPFLLVALGCLLVYAQNDFSTAVIAALTAIAVFWAAGSPLSFFLGLGAAATPLAALSVLTSDFRLRRVLAFLFPAYEPHGQGYQILGSLKAIRSGGLFGKGFGLGSLKRGSIPEVQSDFIFAAWTEETGFLGALAVLGLFAFLAWRAIRAAFAESDGYRSYLGIGMAFLLSLEALVNVLVAAGAVPATGMALPFFSAGGSSLVSTAISCGLLYNLSKSPSLDYGRAPRGTLSSSLARERSSDV